MNKSECFELPTVKYLFSELLIHHRLTCTINTQLTLQAVHHGSWLTPILVYSLYNKMSPFKWVYLDIVVIMANHSIF